MAKNNQTLGSFAARLLRSDPPRSRSLIVTIFGDSLLPYVPELWLGELTTLLKPFHVNAQLTRTSASRLAAEGWLESRRVGRSSRYSLTPSAALRVRSAYRRIYDAPRQLWDGRWTMVIPTRNVSSSARKQLQTELEWAGFGSIVPRVFLHPRPDKALLNELLTRLQLGSDVVIVRATDLPACASIPVSALVADCWDLRAVGEHYGAFLRRFSPLAALLKSERPSPEVAYVLQTLLIHSFRRVILHDPRLPAALLPKEWPGHSAYTLCREVYLRTFRATGEFLGSHLEQGQHKSLAAEAAFFDRMGGLR